MLLAEGSEFQRSRHQSNIIEEFLLDASRLRDAPGDITYIYRTAFAKATTTHLREAIDPFVGFEARPAELPEAMRDRRQVSRFEAIAVSFEGRPDRLRRRNRRRQLIAPKRLLIRHIVPPFLRR